MKPGLRIHIAFDMQGTRQRFGPAVKDARLGGEMDLADRPEHHVPVGPAKVGRRTQARDGVLFGVGVVDHDVGCVVGFDFGGEILRVMGWLVDAVTIVYVKSTRLCKTEGAALYGMNFNPIIPILRLDGQQQRAEPLERAKVATHPEEVHLAQPGLLLRIVHAVPDGFQD